MLRAVIYCRVSTDGQEREGTSLETQESACETYAVGHGWAVVDRIRDTTSGATLERPGLERLRSQVRDGQVDIVLAYAVDWLSRNQTQVAILVDEADRHDVKLDFVTEQFEKTATGMFVMNVRAFVAEIEREKIAERTMRGKAARARSGRIPQATGKGIYGYRYDRSTGKREVVEYQAAVVRRVFQRYAETRSFSAVSNELNDAGVPAFGGGRWYPLTVRSVVMKDAYTGRTIYRRTKRIRGKHGKAKTQVVLRDQDEWIEVDGATPRIVDEELWERVQAILSDPERLRQKPVGRHYKLASRLRCGVCGGAMVGQTLTSRGKPFRYYRCRHAYDKNTGYHCSSRYVRADRLEAAVWAEIQRVLTDPDLVLSEVKNNREHVDPRNGERSALEQERCRLEKRERRLVQLFMEEDLNKEALREEAANLKRQIEAVEAQLASLPRPQLARLEEVDHERIGLICGRIADMLADASNEQCAQVLEALQITVTATRDGATIRGSLPTEVPKFVTIARTSA